MNRTLLVPLVVALAAGGCNSSSCDATDVTFFWRFVGAPVAGQQRIAGNFTAADNGCAAAGIDAVDGIDVTIAGERRTFPCAGATDQLPGITFAAASRGVYDWTIDAYRGGALAFTRSGTIDARSCGGAVVTADLQAVTPQPLVVYYDVNAQPLTSCFYNGPIANVPFEIRDAANRIQDTTCLGYDVNGVCQSEGSNPCDPASRGFVTRTLELGVYTLAYLELWNPLNQPVAAACNQQLVHDGLPAFPLLTSTSQFCPSLGPPSAIVASGGAAP